MARRRAAVGVRRQEGTVRRSADQMIHLQRRAREIVPGPGGDAARASGAWVRCGVDCAAGRIVVSGASCDGAAATETGAPVRLPVSRCTAQLHAEPTALRCGQEVDGACASGGQQAQCFIAASARTPPEPIGQRPAAMAGSGIASAQASIVVRSRRSIVRTFRPDHAGVRASIQTENVRPATRLRRRCEKRRARTGRAPLAGPQKSREAKGHLDGARRRAGG